MTEFLYVMFKAAFATHPEVAFAILIGFALLSIVLREKAAVGAAVSASIHQTTGLLCLIHAVTTLVVACWLFFFTRFTTPAVDPVAIATYGLRHVQFIDLQALLFAAVVFALPPIFRLTSNRAADKLLVLSELSPYLATALLLAMIFVAYVALVEPGLITNLKPRHPQFLWWYSAVSIYASAIALVLTPALMMLGAVWRRLR
jgi:hypothetical protein